MTSPLYVRAVKVTSTFNAVGFSNVIRKSAELVACRAGTYCRVVCPNKSPVHPAKITMAQITVGIVKCQRFLERADGGHKSNEWITRISLMCKSRRAQSCPSARMGEKSFELDVLLKSQSENERRDFLYNNFLLATK